MTSHENNQSGILEGEFFLVEAKRIVGRMIKSFFAGNHESTISLFNNFIVLFSALYKQKEDQSVFDLLFTITNNEPNAQILFGMMLEIGYIEINKERVVFIYDKSRFFNC